MKLPETWKMDACVIAAGACEIALGVFIIMKVLF